MTRRNWLRRLLIVPIALLLLVSVWIGAALAIYPPEYVFRVLRYRESDVFLYLDHLPTSGLTAGEEPFRFQNEPAPNRIVSVLEQVFDTDDLGSFLTDTDTQAFIVIKDDRVLYEEYFNRWERDSLLTSFSVAKSFTSALVGIAIDEGYIGDVDDRLTTYLPELTERDERFDQITIRHLLMMSSGLDYQEMRWFLFNGDDPLTTYHPDQRAISLDNTRIIRSPGEVFSYNKYHPQLLGMVLERTTGRSVTALTQEWIWERIGMEFDGSWSLDSEASGFEKMEAGLNARAVDFAKLGRLFLHDGEWDGERVISTGWVARSTGMSPDGLAPAFDDRIDYAFMWWGYTADDGRRDFFAAGDHGQYIYASPDTNVIIVRNGTGYGIDSRAWVEAFAGIAGKLAPEETPD
jgi:CubicO group peptidase (beta-lactamase class C family)